MNQKITFATLLVAFSVFFICFTNASPIELSPRYIYIYYIAEFSKVFSGSVDFHESQSNVVTATVKFHAYPVSNFEIKIPYLKKQLISRGYIIPGVSQFEYEIKGRTLKDFIGKKVKAIRSDKVLEIEPIVPIEPY
ncbi:hypothetical protein Glove_196g28 [Diversispora epigaea]|uniref:Uncharacterized protein n=1 Tax=Diversispora epigaea TaxID=1348612 RepID=A0A397IS52_9GLOM|nr:hypothetical protein Glove_196g28 [Diversispora epigaea]